ncbi:MAG: membrane dipeptidase [Armatimonadetes bacterium]|nr:membrane dipeptidase [Armatimonadota bacterium]
MIDAHVDTLGKALESGSSILSFSGDSKLHADVERLRKSGVKFQVFAMYVKENDKPSHTIKRTMEMISLFHREARESDGSLSLVTRAEDIDRLGDSDTMGGLLSIEGGEALGGSLALLDCYFDLGVRLMGLTWSTRNELADGVDAADNPSGLTHFGKRVIERMNQLGMVVDLSHIAPPGFWDAWEISETPPIASHSNARALCDHPRNLTDNQIKALAKRGGVIGVTFVPTFLSTEPATQDDVIRHIEYMMQLVGGDSHVGLGSDFDGIQQTPEGLENVSRYPSLLQAMGNRGFSDESIRKISGGNWERILREILPP